MPEQAVFPEEYVCFTERRVYRPKHTRVHSCRIRGAERYTTKEGVCTLPLVFLQVANELTFHQLVYLGLQMCAHPEQGGTRCSLKDLKACAEKLRGHRGRQKALRAIRYIREGARSPMESILYMFLRLPNLWGGCGFTEAEFDRKIQIKKSKLIYFVDLYFPSSKVIIEYDSFMYHDNPSSFSQDSIRAANLEAAGYKVIPVKSKQIYNLLDFETLIKIISKHVDKPLRIRARKFFEGFAALRKFLINKAPRVHVPSRKVERNEFPKFPGTERMYRLYLKSRKRRRDNYSHKLTLACSP